MISLKHAFESEIADGSDDTIVQPSDWNAEHVLTMAESRILGRVTSGTGSAEELTAAQVKALLNLEIGTDVQAYSAILAGTTASFTTADETKLDHITVTQAVDLDALETAVAALDQATILKGTWDASAGTFPGSGAAQAGWTYIVSVGGTVDSVAFVANDRILAIVDNASTTTYAANWHKLDYTDQVLSVAGKTGAVTLQVADITDMTANGRSLVSAANYAAMRTLLDLEAGTDFNAYSANLAEWSGINPSANGASLVSAADYAAMRTLLNFEVGSGVCEGRLTLTSGTAVTTSDVTGATTIYFTPYKGNRIALYSGSAWVYQTFSEISRALGTISDATNYDVFVYDNAGTVAIDTLVAWTNATTRATAITLQDGVWVKSGATTRRYVGTIRTTSTTTTEDSLAKRFVWNMHNRVSRPMRVWETTDTWNWSTASWQQARASTANQLAFVRGLNEDSAVANVSANVVNSTTSVRYVRVSIGLDATTAPAADANVSLGSCTDTIPASMLASYNGLPGIGYHYLAWIEKAHGADTQTWRGDAGQTDLNLGINGMVMA